MDFESVVRRRFDAWAAEDYAALADLYTSDARYVRSDGQSTGPAEIVQYVKDIRAAFPDEAAEIRAILVSAEAVTVEWTENATHLGTRTTVFGDIPPTGRGFKDARVTTVFRFAEGKIASEHEYYDLFGMIVQLGWLGFFAKAFGVS